MPKNREEAITAGIAIAETQHNMKRRKPWHDYCSKGTYMLTLVVEGRRPVLGKLVMPCADAQGVVANSSTQVVTSTQGLLLATTPAESAAGSYIDLTALGKAIRDEEVKKISAIFPMVEIWKLCIMPDHIHMILRVTENMPEGRHLGDVIAGFKGGCSRAWWRLTATTPASSVAGKNRPSLFESGYNDQILLNEGQLDNWKHYLDDNPRRLAIKRLYPDYFTTLHHIDINEWHCQTVGNRFLLDKAYGYGETSIETLTRR